MYDDRQIDDAVAAGALTPEAAAALRAHVAGNAAAGTTAAASDPDEERFRLVTGFNDIFVSIAILLLVTAVWWIASGLVPERTWSGADAQFPDLMRTVWLRWGVSGLAVAATSWGLAEYFTRRRRMALPSILLLLIFAYSLALGLYALASVIVVQDPGSAGVGASWQRMLAVAGAGTALGTWAHWRRFHVPITVAALATAAVATVGALLLAAAGGGERMALSMALLGGMVLFGIAMWWDMSDRLRQTRRADVAFWLHLAAAPMIAHSVFNLLNVMDGEVNVARAVGVLALYVLFGVVAVAIDRRALLVSALVYVLFALSSLFQQAGAVELSLALTALLIGSVLLTLSAFWQPIRRAVIGGLSRRLADRLPPASPIARG